MRSEVLAKEYGLPQSIAQEIISAEIQRSLRTKWQAWAWLVATMPFCAWLAFFGAPDFWFGTFWIFLGCIAVWGMIGRHYALSSIHREARNKADRLAGMRP